MYGRGYDSWHFLTMSTSVAAVEATTRAYFALRQRYDEEYRADAEAEGARAMSERVSDHPRYQAISLLAHAVATTGNLGKLALAGGNPLTLNYPQWLMLAKRLLGTLDRPRTAGAVQAQAEHNRIVIDAGWTKVGMSISEPHVEAPHQFHLARRRTVTVSIHVAPHPDSLIASLCDLLADPLDDPFASELISVPTRGIERWITQRIATELAARGVGDGISANIEFPSPSRLTREVLLADPQLAASVTGWQGPAFTGHVLDAIDHHLDEPWMRLIQRYNETPDGSPSSNRLSAATKIARLYTTYAHRRPGMIRAWRAGEDTGPDGAAIPDGDRWQPLLWRLVAERIGVPAPAELLPEGLEPVRKGEIDLDLPDRISVYGLTSTDPFELAVLAALGEQRDVHLYVLHPSPALWTQTAVEATTGHHVPRDEDPTSTLARHPLLTSWARDSRELQQVLASHHLTATPIETPATEPGTVLARLQHDIRHNLPISFDQDLADRITAGQDRSLQIHIGHGARRQAEIARDAILHALADDPTLEPRDVVIMTPDLATFAPLLESAFPGAEARSNQGLPDLRLRIADRSPAAINPLVRFAATVLGLADGRLEASAVRELVTRPVVQQRFGFDASTAGAIVGVIDDANISWGIGPDDREAWGAGRNDQRTWSRGLDRALAGVFYSDSPVRVVAGTAPLDGIEGSEANPVGLLAAILDRLTALRTMVATPMPMSEWGPAIAAGVRMLAAPAWGDEWQLSQLERLLAETFPEAAPDTPDPLISLAEVRRAIAGWADTRPSPLHFRTGDVTVATLVPMRSVPYRVVCLVGMDDDRFPRSSRADGDDLLLNDEIVGDFDRSAQDRQLLLDAVMAAGDHLIITYSGRDELTNAPLPPAVPIAELTDTLEELVGPEAIKRLVTTHPLQSFSEANFRPGALGVAAAFGFDPIQLAGARAVQARPTGIVPFETAWPDYEPAPTVKLTELIAFLRHPAARFMKTRMGFTVPGAGEQPDDTLPVDLGGLGKWGIKNRLVTGLAAGHDPELLAEWERASDGLPPGALGMDDLEDAVADASVLWEAALEYGYDPARMRPWTGTVAAGATTVEGTVLADPEKAHLATVTPSTLKGKQRLQAFAELVFLTALDPSIEWRAVLLGRRSRDYTRGDHDRSDRRHARRAAREGRGDAGRAGRAVPRGPSRPAPVAVRIGLPVAAQGRLGSQIRMETVARHLGNRHVRTRARRPGPRPAVPPSDGDQRPARLRVRGVLPAVVGPDPAALPGEDDMTAFSEFDPAEPVGPGRTVIEASAGTGKTFTISAVVARLIAEEGIGLDEILVVTFTRAATAELRARVRARLVATLRALHDPATADPNDQHLAALLLRRPSRRATRTSPQASDRRLTARHLPISTGPRSSPFTDSPSGC